MERLYSWIGRKLDIVKITILPRLICLFNALPTKISAVFLVDIEKIILTFTYKAKELDR